MARYSVTVFRFVSICALLLWIPQCASAQRVEDSCHAFFEDPHQALDCAEAIFTQTDIPHHLPHLTLSSVPPDNGFPVGVVWEKRNYYVSSRSPIRIKPSNPRKATNPSSTLPPQRWFRRMRRGTSLVL